MFGLFKQKYCVGIDFGTFSIKTVEVKIEGDSATLVNFGIADVHDESFVTGTPNAASFETRRAQYLAALIQKMQVHTKEVFVSIPGSSGLVAVVEFPSMSQKELAEAVQFEAHKYIPIDMNEVALSWDILHPLQKEEEKKDSPKSVLLVAALKKDIEKSVSVVKQSGLSISAMELETFSLARSLVDGDPGVHLIIDVGFRVSNFVLVGGGDVRMNRSIDVGGRDITKTIMDGMNISFDRAEALKKERDFFHRNEIPLTFPSIEVIMSEVRRMIALFAQQGKGLKIDSIILSGGTSTLPGFAVFCQETLGIPTVVGDPWKRVTYDAGKLSKAMKQELGGTLAIALGLTLRGIEKEEAE